MTGKPWRTVGAVGLFVAASACSTVDPDAVRGDPAALVVAITDVEHGERLAVDAGGLGFRGGASKFHDVLLATLTKYGAASDVIVWQEGSEVFPDVLITPVIERAEPFVHEGVSSGFWASGLLWLGTWIGGLAVDDSNYDTNLVVRFDVRDAVSDFEIQAVNASGGMVSTSFLDRNSFFSWSTVQALILPPFWTSDDIESASVELTDRAVTNASVGACAVLEVRIRAALHGDEPALVHHSGSRQRRPSPRRRSETAVPLGIPHDTVQRAHHLGQRPSRLPRRRSHQHSPVATRATSPVGSRMHDPA